jgi:hypothetical protein
MPNRLHFHKFDSQTKNASKAKKEMVDLRKVPSVLGEKCSQWGDRQKTQVQCTVGNHAHSSQSLCVHTYQVFWITCMAVWLAKRRPS